MGGLLECVGIRPEPQDRGGGVLTHRGPEAPVMPGPRARPGETGLLPGLDEFVVADGDRLFVLVFQFSLRCARLAQPVARVALLVEDRAEIALNAGAFEAF